MPQRGYENVHTTKRKRSALEGCGGSAVAVGAVDPPCQVSDGSLSNQSLQELSLSVHVVHALLQHGTHRQLVIVVQWRPVLGEVVAKACQADLVTQQAS